MKPSMRAKLEHLERRLTEVNRLLSSEASTRDLGFVPRTPIDDGVPKFVAWFRAHHGL